MYTPTTTFTQVYLYSPSDFVLGFIHIAVTLDTLHGHRMTVVPHKTFKCAVSSHLGLPLSNHFEPRIAGRLFCE